jgi:hypothetical protein
MTHIWQGLRSGQWLTAARIRGYSLILLGFCAIAAAGWIVLSDGLIDRNGKPIGTDFSSFYAAGSLVLDGRAADVYNMAAHYAREQQIFGAATPYYGWLYPPIFLLIAAPLALLPYPLALAAWQISTFALYLSVIGAIVRRMRRRGMVIGPIWLLDFQRSSSISDTAKTGFSRPDCLALPCWRCQRRRSPLAFCLVFSPTSRNLRWSRRSYCLPRANGEPSLPPASRC